jgi:hypothetical protein
MSRLSAARKELRLANESLAALRVATDHQKLDECWIKVLHSVERCWNKVRAAMKDNTKWQGWTERGRIEGLRTDDPLLSYLRNARGADEHGLADITVKKPGGLGINPAGRGPFYVDRLVIQNGRITELKSPQSARITVRPATIALSPVVNRKVTYAVPTMHEGSPLAGIDPITVATAGIAFYTRTLDLIEQEFPA